jgi:poly(hydroxyalkanoate) depolymerase family esterase
LSAVLRWRRGAAAVFALAIALASALAVFTAPKAAHAAQFTPITEFGDNPGNLDMYAYVPDNVASDPAIVVVNHWCTGSAANQYDWLPFDELAEQYGYIVIYPDVTRDFKCFDVSSPESLSGTGGDSVSIKSMVDYAVAEFGGDPDRVFATGISSGAMMTNVLLGVYPEVFKAGSVYAGVPYTCFATTDGSPWNSDCATGMIDRTPQEWGDAVRNANPDYEGPWPRMQIYHGTEDQALFYPNFGEQIEQWTDVHGTDQVAEFTDHPEPNWTRTRYGATDGQALVEAISVEGADHGVPHEPLETLRFFGIASTDQAAGEIAGEGSSRCVHLPRSGTANGTQAVLWKCNGSTKQAFTHTAEGELRVNGKCLEPAESVTAEGAGAVIGDCTGGDDQRWTVDADGAIINVHNGLCLDAFGGGVLNGTPLILWTCSGGANQTWSIR